MNGSTSETENADTGGVEVCTYCGQPISPGQAKTTVNGKPMHVSCYQEQTGGTVSS